MIVNFYKVKANNYRDMELLAIKNIDPPVAGMFVEIGGQKFKIIQIVYKVELGEYAALMIRV